MTPAAEKTGRAAVLETHGEKLNVREFPVPSPEPGAIVVEIDCATVCGSDLHIWEGEMGGTYKLPLPVVLGHEMVGRVVELGTGAELDSVGRTLRPGDRIVWANEPCRHCYTCTVEGELTLCPNRQLTGLRNCVEAPHFLGAFAEYGYVTPGASRLRVPDDVESSWASAASCALRTVINSVEAAGRIDFLDSVVIQGAGPLGLFATALVSMHSPKHLVVVGAPDDRLELARAWGATHTVSIEEHGDPAQRLETIRSIVGAAGPSVALELSGARGAVAEGVDMLRPHGRYVVSGTIGGGAQPADFSRLTTRGLSIIGSMSGDIDAYYKALEFLDAQRTRFDWGLMIGSSFGLDQVNDALDSMRRMEQIKPLVKPR